LGLALRDRNPKILQPQPLPLRLQELDQTTSAFVNLKEMPGNAHQPGLSLVGIAQKVPQLELVNAQ